MTSNVIELLDAVSVEDYLDFEGIEWRRQHGSSGEQANIKTCPVCGGSNWKVYLGLDSGYGNCFHGSCETKFNKWTFIKAHLDTDDNKTVADHLKKAAMDMGWRPKRRTTAAVDMDTPGVLLPLSFALPTAEGRNLLYLEQRSITPELAGYFHLRFCEDGWWNYTKQDGSRGGQNFGGRVIIPVFDLDGGLVTFQGRGITPETQDPKYLFPAGLPGTGRFLYNGQNAGRCKRVVINEGAFDVFATKIAVDEESALRDVVPIGTFGKHLSYGDANNNDQVSRLMALKRGGLEEVIFMWDGESEALTAAVAAGERLMKLGLRVRIALLPDDKDPNEVPPVVVRAAIWKAALLTPALIVQWRLRNPYGR